MIKRIYAVFSGNPPNRAHEVVSRVLLVMILVSVTIIIISTEPGLSPDVQVALKYVDLLCLSVFVAEYLLRLFSCVANPEYAHPVWGRLRFMMRPMMIIDLLAIAPMIFIGFGVDLRTLRLFRLARLFSVFKISRYIAAIEHLGRVFQRQKHQLTMTVGVVVFLLVISSTLMYQIEHEAQPKVFTSITAAMWWSVVSLTTVGYGDIYPITPLGKVLAGIVAVLGVGLVALPAGILATGLSEVSQLNKQSKTCPHCGEEIS